VNVVGRVIAGDYLKRLARLNSQDVRLVDASILIERYGVGGRIKALPLQTALYIHENVA
jgi:hypothetical protein